MKKKILLALLVVSMLVCLFAITSSATLIDGIDYSFSGSEATVTSKNQSCEVENVVIPEKVKAADGTEYTVTKIAGEAFRNNTKIKTIVTPSTIKSIGSHAFRTMTALVEIDLNASPEFKYFDNAEFYQTKSLVKADLSGCTGLIDMGNGGTYSHTFLGCTALTTVILPEGLQIIGPQVFKDCTSLVNVTIPSTVTKIGDYAFQGCTSLKSMNLPEGLTYLGCNNFQSSKVEKVILPSTLVTATKDMFNSVKTLNTVVIANADVSGYTASVMTNCSPLNLVFYAGSSATTLTDHFTNLKSYSTVSYAQYLLDIANPEFTGYTSKTIVYGTKNCENCGDVVTNEVKFLYTDYLTEMSDAVVCTCGKTTVVESYAPIMEFVGYSAKINGNRICIGYTINHESLAVFTEKTNKALTFGVTAAVVADGTTQYKTLEDDLTPINDKTVVASVDGKLAGFDFILSGFTSAHYEKSLVMCAFVYDGSKIIYIDNGGCNEYATPFTFNSVAK